MGESSGIGGSAAGLWYRVVAVNAGSHGGGAAADYASVLPAALNAARHRRPFIAGWLSRGGGAPLELITTAGPMPAAGLPARPGAGAVPAGSPAAGTAAAGSPAAGTTGEAAAGTMAAGNAAGTGVIPALARDAPAGGGETPPAGTAAGDARALATPGAEAVEMLYPWGARGIAIDSNMLADLDQLVWAPCAGRQVPLASPVGTAAPPARLTCCRPCSSRRCRR